MHFSQIVEDYMSNCQRLRSSHARSRNSFSSFNPPPFNMFNVFCLFFFLTEVEFLMYSCVGVVDLINCRSICALSTRPLNSLMS